MIDPTDSAVTGSSELGPEPPASSVGSVERVVLASQSPRRRRLLGWLGLTFEAMSVDTPEDLSGPLASDPPALAACLAAEKASTARASGQTDDALVLCFDTIVVLDNRIIGKPSTIPDAWDMLRGLSGRTHEVITGIATLCPADENPEVFSVATPVRMKHLTDEDIEEWMARGEFMGCAGAYNIEGQVAEVDLDQCHQNVAGLPLCHLFAAMSGGVTPCLASKPTSPVPSCDAALRRTCGLGPRLVRAAR
jgi:septum formation protein